MLGRGANAAREHRYARADNLRVAPDRVERLVAIRDVVERRERMRLRLGGLRARQQRNERRDGA